MGLFALLEMHQQAFLNVSVDVKVADILLNKDAILLTVPEENLNQSLTALKLTSSFNVALDFFTKFSMVGLVYSLILSLIFKKKNETGN